MKNDNLTYIIWCCDLQKSTVPSSNLPVLSLERINKSNFYGYSKDDSSFREYGGWLTQLDQVLQLIKGPLKNAIKS